eukprot:1066366-Prymnesium_polylepis.4
MRHRDRVLTVQLYIPCKLWVLTAPTHHGRLAVSETLGIRQVILQQLGHTRVINLHPKPLERVSPLDGASATEAAPFNCGQALQRLVECPGVGQDRGPTDGHVRVHRPVDGLGARAQ